MLRFGIANNFTIVFYNGNAYRESHPYSEIGPQLPLIFSDRVIMRMRKYEPILRDRAETA